MNLVAEMESLRICFILIIYSYWKEEDKKCVINTP